MKLALLFCTLSFTATAAYSQQVLPLYYPDSIPNSKPAPDKEETTTNEKGVVLASKISHPTLTVFLPKGRKGTCPAVIICPGGGYWVNAMNIEGYDEAKIFNSWGVAAIVLKYRIPDSANNPNPSIAPLQDAQQAFIVVRQNASKWKIDPHRVGLMGFSAGGHLASTAATHFSSVLVPNPNKMSVRPDWLILGYPVVSSTIGVKHSGSFDKLLGAHPSDSLLHAYSNETQVTDDTPPTFLVHASDDNAVSPVNSILFYEALLRHHVPAELHIYQSGGHGFGLHLPNPDEHWMERCRNWMTLNKWLN